MKKQILLFIIALMATASSFSQTISLSAKEMSLKDVFIIIKQQTGYVVFYNKELLKGVKPVTVEVKAMPVRSFLDLILKDQPLKYAIEDKTVMLSRKEIHVDQQELTGVVRNEKGEPIVGATVTVQGSKISAVTDAAGVFVLKGVGNDVLVVTSIGYEAKTVRVGGEGRIEVRMEVAVKEIEEVVVKGNTGYQVIDRSHPGSFDVVDNKLFNRRMGLNVLDRIQDLTPGILFNKSEAAPDPILIRGRSSINSSVAPLIVLDNFPYNGELSNINVNDIESITILKDAASASIWGARSGNGVIVITTKRGKTSKPQVDFRSDLTVNQKPDLYSTRRISVSEGIEVEKYLFDKGYYDFEIADEVNASPLSPVVEILLKKRNKQIDEDEANKQINELKKLDVRDDLNKYFYRTGILSQNSLSVGGSHKNISYRMSAGWNMNKLSNLVGSSSEQITLRSQNTFRVNDKISFDVGLAYSRNSSNAGNNQGSISGKGAYPYADLVDENGNALEIASFFRKSFTDTIGQGKLLDWKYRPYEEIYRIKSIGKTTDFVVNTGVHYTPIQNFSIDLNYQFQNEVGTSDNLFTEDSYYTRDLINSYYQPMASNKYPVPKGGILNFSTNEVVSQQFRLKGIYIKNFGSEHQIHTMAGADVTDRTTKGANARLYGYKEGMQPASNMDFSTQFPLYHQPWRQQNIPNSNYSKKLLDRFVSYYASASYLFKDRYSFSISARNDAANLFGVKTNQQGVPLWSAGLGWELSKEKFYQVNVLPYLRLRGTYGYNGNFSRSTSALSVVTFKTNNLGMYSAEILNPPNDDLRWEQVRIMNLGLDFSLRNNRLGGTFEYYTKHNKDLMSDAPIDPTTGVFSNQANILYRNIASSGVKGYDITLNSLNTNGRIKWSSYVVFSYAMSKVTEYFLPAPTKADDIINTNGQLTPVVGMPMYVLYSYRWAGLDPETGDPQGYLGNAVSKDYRKMFDNTNKDSLIYHGVTEPSYYGAFRNDINWKNLSISFKMAYRFGYVFRRNSISYGSLFGGWVGHSDYLKRWQKSGDESSTTVPSMTYIDDPQFDNRMSFYRSSEILVEKGDHVRLDDIVLSYSLKRSKMKRLPFSEISLSANFTSLGILLWKANDEGIDPDLIDVARPGKSIGFSLNILF